MTQHSNPLPAPNSPAASQPKIGYTPTPAESELIRLSREWMDIGLATKDETWLREIMSPEYTLQIWDATRAPQTFDMWLDTLKRRLDNLHFEYSGINARIYGNVGIVYSRFWWRGTMDGKPFLDSGFMLDVWLQEHNKWRVVSRRSAPQQQLEELAKMIPTA